MTAACIGSRGCWRVFTSCERGMRSDSHVRPLIWWWFLLVVLLAEKASCDQTSAAPTSSLPTLVQYVIDVTVDVTGQEKDESDIKAWLVNVFQSSLDSCYLTTTSTTNDTLTTTAATPGTAGNNTTTAQSTLDSNNTTTGSTSVTLNNTTTAQSTPNSNNTTTGSTSVTLNNTTTAQSTQNSNNTTTAQSTLDSNNTTTAQSTPNSNNTTTGSTSIIKNNTSTATLEGNKTTTATTATLENSSTTTPTSLESNKTTATTTPSNSTTVTTTTLESSSTTAATALESNSTTTSSNNETTATTTSSNNKKTATTTSSNNETTATTTSSNNKKTATTTTSNSTTTTLESSSTTASKTNQAAPKGQTSATTSSSSASNSKRRRRSLRLVRDVSNVTQSSETNDTTPGLFQSVELSCATDASIRTTDCTVTLQLRQTLPSCCILRSLCAASNTSSNISVVGRRVYRVLPQNACNSSPQENNSCTYAGPANRSCAASQASYVTGQTNSTSCGPVTENSACSCLSYCNNTDAYYTFQISILNPELNSSYVSSLVSQKLKQAQNCTQSSTVLCASPVVGVNFKDVSVTCGIYVINRQNCSVILRFANEVPICAVAAAMTEAFQSRDQISYDGLVTRAAICGNSSVSSSLSTSQFTWMTLQFTPAMFCVALQELNPLVCVNGGNVVVLLTESCTQTNTTASPNVTPSMNTTTAKPLNATTLNITAPTTTANTPGSVTPATGTNETAESQANALLDLTKDMSKLNSSQIEQLVSQLDSLLSGPNVSLALGNTSVNIVSNLLNASPEQLAPSATRIIRIVDTVGLKLVLSGAAQTLLSPSVALSVKPADGSNFQETFFSISDPSSVQVHGIPRLTRSVTTASSIPQGSIILPSSLTHNLSPQQQQLATRVQFNFYQKSTVFQDKSLGQRKLNSGIMGASVANLSISGLKDNVVIYLRNTEPVPANFVASCVFWDFTLNNRSGGWNPDGCVVQNSTDNVTVCGCNHLTSFAVLLDISRQSVTSPLQDTILTFITYIGCGVSAIFLSITLLTYLIFEKLRKDVPSKILIQLCFALLLLNLVFLVDAWLALYTDAVGLCISTAWFLHYFLLVSFTWMGLEGVHMYNALVKVFNNNMSHYMLKFSLVGWGVPMIVVVIVIAIKKDNYGLVSYGKFTDGRSDEFCWLTNDIAFYVAVVAYFCVVFLFNLVMFVVVLVQLCRIKKQNPHNLRHRSTLEDMRSVAGITVLLGLTWGFAFFAWGPVNLAFMYLFAIFNSFQGLFIFVFYCAVKENVKRQWRTYLCCGKMRLAENSEWSRTATQKPLSNLKTSQSNSSSSSTSFLVTDSSEQSSSISNPTDDRVITAHEDASMDVILNEINSQSRNQPAS